MQEAYKPNPRIVDRAVALWIEMLRAPKYDNLGPNSPEGFGVVLSNTMASVLAHAAPKNNTPEVLARFGAELKGILLHGFTTTNLGRSYHHIPTYLSVDYEPDTCLAAAAERAGLKMEFPWKTSMAIDENSLSIVNGHSAPQEYHYPLSGDRWLVTRLRGEDMSKIIALVEGGVLTPELKAGVFAGAVACPQGGHEFEAELGAPNL